MILDQISLRGSPASCAGLVWMTMPFMIFLMALVQSLVAKVASVFPDQDHVDEENDDDGDMVLMVIMMKPPIMILVMVMVMM